MSEKHNIRQIDRPPFAIKGAPGLNGFKERLACVRKMRCQTQEELAKKVGLKPCHISHFETGNRLPNLKNLRALSVELDVSCDYLLDTH